MKVDIAVCGRFHFHKYLKYLVDEQVLNTLYCSYKVGFDFGIPAKLIKNYLLKEYLMYFNLRLLKSWRMDKNILFYNKLWEASVCSNLPEADILHVMIHGNVLNVIKQYKEKGKLVIGEAVNAHPVVQREILSKEYKKNGLKYVYSTYRENRMIEEFNLCDYILTPSTFVAESFLKQGFHEEKVIKIPYGLEETKDSELIIKPRCWNKNKYKILCVATICFRKGQIYLIEAIKELKKQNENIELTLVGALDSEYYNILKQNNLLDFFIHIPHVDNSNMLNFMKQYDLFVLPSIEDGFAVVVSEALSIRLPVITTVNTGAADLINEGVNGFVIEISSSEAIAKCIEKSLMHNFSMDIAFCSWEGYASRLLDIYKTVISCG